MKQPVRNDLLALGLTASWVALAACKSEPEKTEPPARPVEVGPGGGGSVEVEHSAAVDYEVGTTAVVVRVGAPLYQSMDGEEVVAKLGDVERATHTLLERGQVAGHGFELLSGSLEDSRIEVRALATAQGTACVVAPEGLRRVDVPVFVDPSDLVQVVVHRWEHRWSDGTGVVLEPGAAARGEGGGEPYEVDADGVDLVVELPSGAVGHIVDLPADADLPPVPGKASSKSITDGPGLRYAGERVLKTLAPFPTRSEIDRYPKVSLGDRRGGSQYVSMAGNCAQVTGLVESVDLRLEARDDTDLWSKRCHDECPETRPGEYELAWQDGDVRPDSGTYHRLVEGTALTWPDGSAAGATRERIDFMNTGTPASEDRLCYRDAAGLGGQIELCAARNSVQEIQWAWGGDTLRHPIHYHAVAVPPFVRVEVSDRDIKRLDFSTEDAVRVLRRASEGYLECWRQELAEGEDPTIDLVTTFTTDGYAPTTSIAKPGRHAEFEACVLEVVERDTEIRNAAEGNLRWTLSLVEEIPAPKK